MIRDISSKAHRRMQMSAYLHTRGSRDKKEFQIIQLKVSLTLDSLSLSLSVDWAATFGTRDKTFSGLTCT